MKTCLSVAAFLLCFSLIATAQKRDLLLYLNNGSFQAPPLTAARIDSFNRHAISFKNKTITVWQFEKLPDEALKRELAINGVELLEYIPQNAYAVSSTGKLQAGLLQQWGVRAVTGLSAKQKLHPALAERLHAGKRSGDTEVQILYPKTFVAADVITALKEKGMLVIASPFSPYRVLTVRVATGRLEELASYPFISYVQPAKPKDQPLNFNSRVSSRASVLNQTVADGGRGLNGEGVVIGIGDDGDAQFHADFSGRLINRTTGPRGWHATHVHGTAAGAGIVKEQYRGYAPKATIVSQDYSAILEYAPLYVQDYSMAITSNSYGVITACGTMGYYDFSSYILDQQAFDMPNLQHVFAAGNSGGNTCSPYPKSYNTVLSGYQTAKNVLTVGNAAYGGTIVSSSSRGPVADGRIKPEITALGNKVISATPGNGYGEGTGTSMAAPAVSGGLALLYQRYRQLHGNQEPKAGLMKALLCNGATDKGTAGPDYTFGFGFMNLERSVSMLEAGHYFTGTITNGATNTHTITVPANAVQLNVMLYWNDPPPAFASSRNLVNDLDLRVVNPSALTIFPKILSTTPGSVANAATEGADHINNIEQVVVNTPAAGTYTINIQGNVAQNPSQEYYVVYDFVMAGAQLVFPTGGSVLTPGESTTIAWDAYDGTSTNTFTLQYSVDSGVTWSNIATDLSATTRTRAWTVPTQVTDKALVRLTRSGTLVTSTSGAFTVIGTPIDTLDATQCEGYISIGWQPVANATDYEVLLLRNAEMIPVDTTAATSYSFSGLSKDSLYYVGVRARINGKPGWRSVSIARQPNNGTCSGTISDGDLKLHAIVAPLSGRKATTTELGTAAVTIAIKNLDDAPLTGFTVQYRINGSTWVFENVSATINAGASYTYTFGTTEDFSAVGSYTITAVVKGTADIVSANDTLITTIKQLDNAALDLKTPFVDDLESAAIGTYNTSTTGLDDADRYDFSPSAYGRLRTFVNSGVAFSGNRALVVDADRNLAPSNSIQYLTGTYNLFAYQAGTNDLRLHFNSINGGAASAENRVWIRGNETQPWIELYAPLASGTSPSLEIGNALKVSGQNFSSSFQVRWGVPAIAPVGSLSASGGLLLDDIRLYEVFNDMQLLRIDTPYTLRCDVSGAVPVKISVRNSSNLDMNNVPVRYQINGGAWVFENITSVPADTNLSYTFTQKADLSMPGVYQVTANVDAPGDSYPGNNAASVTVYNSATVSSFPYLQNFEQGDGGWYADGWNKSWEYGTPASPKISGAASGTKAWKTTLAGSYNDNERSYLYSPCFNIADMSKPTISFSVALDLEDCGAYLCDGAWLEFSIDNKTWYNLADLNNAGTNWYKAPRHVWSIENNTVWHVATMNLPTGYRTIRFRFVMRSDGSVTREGVAIDDIHIYDNTNGIYTGPTLSAPVTKAVSGSGWVHFESGGRFIASVLPNNQDLGSTSIHAYMDTGATRYNSEQYYLDRNITIKPTNRNLAAPATVRLYFLAQEIDSLLNATGCATCTKPESVYDLGISKYSAADVTIENGTLGDNKGGEWSFILPAAVTIVPFDKGYYAEFEVNSFSEFWFNGGGTGGNTPLPVRLVDFTATRKAAQVVLRWITADEHNVARYDIEVARGTEDLKKARFETIGAVESNGNTTAQRQYGFVDNEGFKSGVRYYRLKMWDNDGTFRYSGVRSVLFSNAFTWQVAPNPSAGVFQLVYQAAANEDMPVRIVDVTGRTVQTAQLHANGFVQKRTFDLTAQPPGVYLLHVHRNGALQSFKLYKR